MLKIYVTMYINFEGNERFSSLLIYITYTPLTMVWIT